MFQNWELLAGKTSTQKMTLRAGMSQYWLQIVMTWNCFSSDVAKQIDDANWQAHNADGLDDACFMFIDKTACLNALFTTFFKERYFNVDPPEVLAEKEKWASIVIEKARVDGYRRWRDGRQYRVQGRFTRMNPSTKRMLESRFEIDTIGVQDAQRLIQALDEYNHVKVANIIHNQTGMSLMRYNNTEGFIHEHNQRIKETYIQTDWEV